jgi:hypothetical protein
VLAVAKATGHPDRPATCVYHNHGVHAVDFARPAEIFDGLTGPVRARSKHEIMIARSLT